MTTTNKKGGKGKGGKVTIEVKHGLLDDPEFSLAITAKFSILEIKMKNDLRWKVKMLVHKILPKTHHDYAVKLEFDDAPYLRSIEQYEKEIKDVGANPTLLPDVDKKSIARLDEKIAQKRKEMRDMQKNCPNIEFVTQSEEIKYKDGDTALLFRVLDTVIPELNERKHFFKEYRAVLDPII